MNDPQNRSDKDRQARRRGRSSAPPRIEPLAVLPIFMKLHGRRVIVTGGDAPSAWKAELVRAAGAAVTVYAAEVGEEMEALAERPEQSGFGTLEIVRRAWALDDLANAALLIGDAATDGEAWALKCAGQAAGVPVNVIDKPSWCQFQFSTIVNRSPVVIAISTDGAAPIVGQAVRQRVEAVLGPALGAWAKLAERIRPTVNERLAIGPERRSFWQAFAARVFGPAPEERMEDDLVSEIESIRTERPRATISLVGMGQASGGEVTGLTLGALGALQSADCILHVEETPSAILELGRREAERRVIGLDGDLLQAILRAVAGRTEAGQSVAVLLPGNPVSQWPELATALEDIARSSGLSNNNPPAIADSSFGSGEAYVKALLEHSGGRNDRP
ncbi:siroheme synthase [Notoacmeibacter ruber]|uniref:precorrin-2 dehydrogenase n=1 Tax=Notoacmeibacter ruber TaxID=2670375 RepID=A0A3L7JCC4_9HYPH|nr:NAD(P)-dependent oxidoreductase [Notoacmeibacter ruber]RLQ88397.1 siroheme synthase [Notoacmeibacter ruber]